MIPKGLLDEIKRWIKEGLYGHLQINFSAGKIMSINRVQTVKVEMLIMSIPQETCTTDKLVLSDSIKIQGTESPSKTL